MSQCKRLMGNRSDIRPSDDCARLGGSRTRLAELRAGRPGFPFKLKGYVETNPYGIENRVVLPPYFNAYRVIKGAYL
jgi:hypothetical protein